MASGGAAHAAVPAPAAPAIPGRAPTAARPAVATAGQAVLTIDPTTVRTAVRPMSAARAVRRTARTAPLPEARATCPRPARKAKPTTTSRNEARRPVPTAPSPVAAAAQAPRALTVNPTPLSATGPGQPARPLMALTARPLLGPILMRCRLLVRNSLQRRPMVGNPAP